MRSPQRILIIVLLCFPLFARAEDRCLWLNAATAGGILGGAVDVKVSKSHSAGAPPMQTANAYSSAGPMSANPTGTAYADAGLDDAECIFQRQPPGSGQLRIQVRTVSEPANAFLSYSKQCGARGAPLKAIGNEAVMCDAKSKGRAEQIFGRVRDRVFVIDLSMSDRSIMTSALRDKAQSAAQIVAGNLF
jgi:hypothetical protein